MTDDLIARLRAYIAQREKIRDGGITITECNGVPLTVTDLREAADALEAAREDAERYRWLRSLDGSCDAAACVNINIGFDWIEQHGADLDADIDAAREAPNG